MPEARMTFDYRDANVLVTGGSQGIGFAIAMAYQNAGANVTVTGTRANAGDYSADLSAFRYLTLDVREAESIHNTAAAIDALDILVNNAGASLPGGQDEWQPDVFAESLRINLTAGFELATALKPHLRASRLPGGASVIGIASLTSFFAVEVVPGYGAAKAGVVQLTKTLGVSWARAGIRANAVAAGMIETRMTEGMQSIPEMNDPIMARTPLQRWGQPADIASAVLFLTSADASFITGQTLIVDGGYSVFG
ncbi:MAG: SDR family oxidoreductase [Pseudomonadota bacterium]